MTRRLPADLYPLFATGQQLTQSAFDDLIDSSDISVNTADYFPAVDANLAGLEVERLNSGNLWLYRGHGTLTTTFTPDVNAWYTLVTTSQCPEIALFQGTSSVVWATWLSTSGSSSTVLWTNCAVRYDATGLYAQVSSAPAGAELAYQVMLMLDKTKLTS